MHGQNHIKRISYLLSRRAKIPHTMRTMTKQSRRRPKRLGV